jgi:Tfp pilus assembly protein PilZ
MLRMDGIAKDLALGGMFIETETPAPLNEEIRVHLRLPDAPKEMVLTAVVRWTRRDGMGVQFGLMGAVDTHALTEFLHKAGS